MQNLYLSIPDEQLAAVENALMQTFNTKELEDISLMEGGLSASSVYKILIKGRNYVLKLDGAAEYITKEKFTSMEVAAKGAIAPQVFYLNRENGISIIAFVQNKPLRTIFKSPEALLTALAKTIQGIHTLPLFDKENNLFDTVDGLIRLFKASKMLTGPVFNECFDYYDIIKKHYPWQDPDKVSSHNDLNPNNILCDGEKIWVIDWNAAFKSDRYIDLAITANFYISDDQQERIFLKAYFGSNLNNYHMSRFFIMRQICRLVYAMLMFKLADQSKPTGTIHHSDMQQASLKEVKEQLGNGKLSLATYNGQLAFGKALFNEALNSMRLPRFAKSIEELQIA